MDKLNVFYFCSSLNPRLDYWLLEQLSDSSDINLILIDVYELLCPPLSNHEAQSSMLYEYDISIRSYDRLYDFLETIGKGDIAFAGTGGGVHQIIRRYLTEKCVFVICDTTFGLPFIGNNRKKEYSSSFRKIRSRSNLRFLKKKIAQFIGYKRSSMNSIDERKKYLYLLTSGRKSHLSFKFVSDCKNRLSFYHRSVISNSKTKINEGSFALFIDQAIPFHRDNVRKGYNYDEHLDSYYKSLKSFLHTIEDKYSCKVIVSLHPRHSKQSKQYFKGFICYEGETSSLIRDSQFVIVHFSTCIYDAVYRRKPIVFFENELIRMHHDYDFMKYISSLLCCNIVSSVDDCIIDINEDAYDSFIEDYVIQKPTDANKDLTSLLISEFGNDKKVS